MGVERKANLAVVALDRHSVGLRPVRFGQFRRLDGINHVVSRRLLAVFHNNQLHCSVASGYRVACCGDSNLHVVVEVLVAQVEHRSKEPVVKFLVVSIVKQTFTPISASECPVPAVSQVRTNGAGLNLPC